MAPVEVGGGGYIDPTIAPTTSVNLLHMELNMLRESLL